MYEEIQLHMYVDIYIYTPVYYGGNHVGYVISMLTGGELLHAP